MFPVIMLLSLVPNIVLLAGSVWLLSVCWRQYAAAPNLRIFLCIAVFIGACVSLFRFSGWSLGEWPWFGERLRVLDPVYESTAIGIAFMVGLGCAFVAAVAQGLRRSLPRRCWGHFAALGFILACLGGNLMFNSLGDDTPWIRSPDGTMEIRYIPIYCLVDVNGDVVFRHPGDRVWRYLAYIGNDFASPQNCTLSWTPDSRAALFALHHLWGDESEIHEWREFRRFGDDLVELPGAVARGYGLKESAAELVFAEDPAIVFAMDYYPDKSHEAWRLSLDRTGQVEEMGGSGPLRRFQISPSDLAAVSDLVSHCVSETLPAVHEFEDYRTNEGAYFVLRIRDHASVGKLRLKMEAFKRGSTDPGVRLLRSFLHDTLTRLTGVDSQSIRDFTQSL